MDGAVALFCAVGGVEAQSETVWRQANKYGVPRIAFVNKMDRSGADFFKAVREIKEKLGANPVPLVLPIGAEDNYQGIIDLVEMKAYVWENGAMEATVKEIPENMMAEAQEWREKLVEAAAVQDEALMERFFSFTNLFVKLPFLVFNGFPTIYSTVFRERFINIIPVNH